MVVRWNFSAKKDLLDIFNYISKDSESLARNFIDQIKNKTEILSEFPKLGKSDGESGLRFLVVHKNYRLTYRIVLDRVEVLQVYHTRLN